MNVHDFIRVHQTPWKKLQSFLEQARRLSLARVPLEVFREGSTLYRQAVADLAYARMSFGDHAVVRQLDQLVGQGHSILYQAGQTKSRNWWDFWRRTWPAEVRRATRPILLALAIFWLAAIVGYFLTVRNPVLESYFVSPAMRQAINSGHLWTESLTHVAPAASSQIAVNNIVVGIVPLLLIAACIEGFVSPSDLSGVAKAALGLVLAVTLLAYIVSAPAVGAGEDGR